MPAVSVTPADWAALRARITGEVVVQGSPGYDQARKPAIARFQDARPRAVVFCATAEDVAEALAVARRSGLPAVPRSGGHCFAGRSSGPGMVIDVTPMRSVSVTDRVTTGAVTTGELPTGEVATGEVATGGVTTGAVTTIGAGARLGEVYDALGAHGLTIPAGCGPGVGIAGLTLGGGLGILGRTHGLTCDSLLAARVVLADGSAITCDGGQASDLFWALRGAGHGTFGVVTTLDIRTGPEPDTTAFHLTWRYEHAERVIRAWQDWAPAAPGELAASLLITASGARPLEVNVFGAMLGGEAATVRMLGELKVHDPATAYTEPMPYRDTKRYLAELGDQMTAAVPEAGHSFVKSEFFRRPLPDGAVAALVAGLGRDLRPGQARELDFSPWGGAYNRVAADATAFPHRDALFLLKQAVTVSPADDQAAARDWLARSWAAAHPWGTGGAYPNFPDPDLPDPDRAYYLGNYDRLREVKARYDPAGFFGR
ncbi:MAG TPA: FAD-binding oxidoreductase [Streptosporangiaceae bacterium]|nr:FAD-binding oxidoreductase [Streptosporangiaceae bacterium]